MIDPQAFEEQRAILRVEHRGKLRVQSGSHCPCRPERPVRASTRSRTAWLRSFQSVRRKVSLLSFGFLRAGLPMTDQPET
jgi:hypothetical protein